jgi:hypothetical protein
MENKGNAMLKDNMKLTNIEADFLTHCIEVWCNETPQIAGRPVMFTTQEGGNEKVLLTHDQIESLFLRIQALKQV